MSRPAAAFVVALGLTTGLPVGAEPARPAPQLAQSVASQLGDYGIDIRPETLTLKQAGALHTLMGSDERYLEIRRRALNILSAERFR